jgi:lipopolysaccharide transport system permease protein
VRERTNASDRREVSVIEPRRRGARERLRELWTYRGLFKFFGGRAMDKMTARTVIGRPWLVLRPVLDVATVTLIFGGLLSVPSSSIPYFLFFVAGRASWVAFETSVLWSTRSLEFNRKLLAKVYFPRLILPVASISPAIVELSIYLTLLLGGIVYFGIVDGTMYLQLGPQLLAAVAALILGIGLALAIGVWTSVLGANARDVRFSLQYGLGFWLYLTPVFYPLSLVPDSLQTLAAVNPMTPVVELFKWAVFDAGEVLPLGLAYTSLLIVVVGATGLSFFGRREAAAVDSL